MTRRHYDWRNGPADIEQHSIAKHNVLRAYLARYFETLAGYPHHDRFRLTLIDGFAGGGEYVHKNTKELILGSPFVCLEAVKEAEIKLNIGRKKPFTLDVQYFFVEKNHEAHRHLEQSLRTRHYGARIGQDIHLRNAAFQVEAAEIIAAVKARSPRSGRAIFVLDQYGYKDVPGPLIQSIFSALPGAEVVLTFAVDSLITYANDGTITTDLLRKLGLEGIFGGRTIEEIRGSDREWRLLIQSVLYKGLIERCGARHYTPFFIRNPRGHGDYWLIHMSQHPRARDVMTEVHWGHHNHFIHYGGAGLQMFQMVGYDPDSDSTFAGQDRLGFEFDNVARKQSIAALMEQLPERIYSTSDGISFGELFDSTCNQSPATAELYKAALANLIGEKVILVTGKKGGVRQSARSIQVDDRLSAPRQRDFFI